MIIVSIIVRILIICANVHKIKMSYDIRIHQSKQRQADCRKPEI